MPEQVPVPPAPAASRSATPAPGGSSSALRREILLYLRRTGPSSPDAIASSLRASRSGVTQQLRALETASLVSRTTARHGVGRPRHLYDVTPDAQGLFPTNYDGLATSLLSAILEVGGEALMDEIFLARRRQAESRTRDQLLARVPEDAPLAERLGALAAIQDELGYLAEVRHEGDVLRLVEHNCAVLHVASGNPAACQAELELFSSLLQARVERVSHIRAGDRCCSYVVQPGDA